MVLEVTAFQAEDGSIHQSLSSALQSDAMLKLKKMDCFNHGSAQAIIAQAEYVVDALTPLADYRRRQNSASEIAAVQPQSESI